MLSAKEVSESTNESHSVEETSAVIKKDFVKPSCEENERKDKISETTSPEKDDKQPSDNLAGGNAGKHENKLREKEEEVSLESKMTDENTISVPEEDVKTADIEVENGDADENAKANNLKSNEDHRQSRSQSPRGRSRTTSIRDHSPAKPSKVIGVFGLNPRTRARDMEELLSKYAPVERVHLIEDSRTGQPKGFGFAYFASEEDAKLAKEGTNGVEFLGRIIRVDYSKTAKPHSPTPGRGYLGRKTSVSPRRDYDRRGGRDYDMRRGDYDRRGGRDYDMRREDYGDRGRDYDRRGRDYDRRGRDYGDRGRDYGDRGRDYDYDYDRRRDSYRRRDYDYDDEIRREREPRRSSRYEDRRDYERSYRRDSYESRGRSHRDRSYSYDDERRR